ncbi:MAG: Rieske (2Fe-2S) protein, partial [Myxococcaceae bacterium]|nr:Rieske (2Fe-2S) protein [Myxococcaceae bacterium]
MTSPGICDDQARYDSEVEDGQLVVIDFPEM